MTKKIFQTPSSKFEGRGGDFLEKKFFLSKKIFFDMKNIENSVSKTLRQKLRQVQYIFSFYYHASLIDKIFFICTLLRFANVPQQFFFHCFFFESQKSFAGNSLSSFQLSFSRSFTESAFATLVCFFCKIHFSACEMMASAGHSFSGCSFSTCFCISNRHTDFSQ